MKGILQNSGMNPVHVKGRTNKSTETVSIHGDRYVNTYVNHHSRLSKSQRQATISHVNTQPESIVAQLGVMYLQLLDRCTPKRNYRRSWWLRFTLVHCVLVYFLSLNDCVICAARKIIPYQDNLASLRKVHGTCTF